MGESVYPIEEAEKAKIKCGVHGQFINPGALF
jgi:hypothetical protein